MDLAIIVMSCDAFEDVWQPFFTLFNRYWADCPFPKYFCTDAKPAQQDGFIDITPGKNLAWSYRLQYALRQIPQKYVLFLQDDFFLLKPANTQKIIQYLAIIQQENAGVLRIFPSPPPSESYKNYTTVGLLKPYTPYRVSCQAAIWDKDVLLELVNPTENIWAFETEGTQRSNALSQVFLSVYIDEAGEPLEKGDYAYTYFCTAVYKGKWMRGAVAMCEQEGIHIDLTKRPVETWWLEKRRYLYDHTPNPLQKYVWYLLFKVLKFLE
jgi:hypothetical protein